MSKPKDGKDMMKGADEGKRAFTIVVFVLHPDHARSGDSKGLLCVAVRRRQSDLGSVPIAMGDLKP